MTRWLLALVLSACTLGTPPAAPSITSPTVVPSVSASATPSSCMMRGMLPDALCTPGVVDSRVTQANIASTICVSGYTAAVRPPATYTDALKRDQMVRYGDIGASPAAFEEDHLVPLELGGHPTDPRNLWPQPRAGFPAATSKDHLENELHRRVCAGTMRLEDAQHAIATDWVAAWEAAGRP